MKIKSNTGTETYNMDVTRAELEIMQNALCISMSQIDRDFKEDRRMTVEMAGIIDKTLMQTR
jgi:hypothetical protein